MAKPNIGITIGDINGIGLEVILKTISNPLIYKHCTPIIYGSTKVVSYHKNIFGIPDLPFQTLRPGDTPAEGKLNIVNCWQDNVNINLGEINESGGKYAKIALECVVKDMEKGIIDAVVTAPIHKQSMKLGGFDYIGHTEFFSKVFGDTESLMMLISDNMKVGLVTTHIPVSNIKSKLTTELISKKIKILRDSLITDFEIDKPIIAVLGLNPHAGDDGLMGTEEKTIILPAIEKARAEGITIVGPYPADGFFGSGEFKKFDAILAIYHDQGLIPFKLANFSEGVNYTAGLPYIRTSPDHGTAFDIAGKNLADPTSFRKALYAAIDIFTRRSEYFELREDTMERLVIREESEEELLRNKVELPED
ncbi:MAG: 4-hydroxythreonine-4-phosphate dehydrogenase PdxA [Saprospiraceae bacterium]|jgi:4-hydroxythreonine-4-phosphate dehydrogenase|nr:4-hydroxythreonine-4-phosphate dehydrogenase PdxA [Saprospiraceae bacterium]MBL0292821.1 4-hydroxythreonine-4-phosphate dehydrogenase PdxA [Saprospiraceae bacterium]